MPFTPRDKLLENTAGLAPRGVSWAMAALVVVVLAGATYALPAVRCSFGVSKARIVEREVDVLAHDLYLRWRAKHPGRWCPSTLRELAPERRANDLNDPYGTPYWFVCENGLVAISAGEDARFGTADDVRSDR